MCSKTSFLGWSTRRNEVTRLFLTSLSSSCYQASAGNVLRPRTVLKLSLRLPPTLPAPAAATFVKGLLEKVRRERERE